MPGTGRIRVISVCLFRDGDRILVFEWFDRARKAVLCRPLGGEIEFGETSEDAVVREVREEINQEATALRLLGVLENHFENAGKRGHEIVFVHDGRFADTSVYDARAIPGKEEGEPISAVWRSLRSFDARHRLVPEGLWRFLDEGKSPPPRLP